jgi:hypothetical protein
LTSKPLPAEWWELLIQQVEGVADAKDHADLPSIPPLQQTDQPTRSPGQTIREHTDASENDLRPADKKAA